MINETTIERAIVDRITAHADAFAADTPNGVWFKLVDNVGLYDIDIENIRDVVKITPACLVEYGGESASDLGTTATSSNITARIYVYVFVVGKMSHKQTSEDANALARAVKGALRGWYARTDGQSMHLRYRGATPRGRIDGAGMLIKALEFELITQDHS